jgi:hypothetical protein
MAWLRESRLRSTDVADSSLVSTITLTPPSAEDIVSVTGVLFNGQPVAEGYVLGSIRRDSAQSNSIPERSSGPGRSAKRRIPDPIPEVLRNLNWADRDWAEMTTGSVAILNLGCGP